MRNARVKRKRKSIQSAAKSLARAPALVVTPEKLVRKREEQKKRDLEKRMNLYKRMARSFWERWQWELKERKDATTREKMLVYQKRGIMHMTTDRDISHTKLHNINRLLLCDPTVHRSRDNCNFVLGQGSFGVVKLKTYRGINVAVKEFFSRTILSDVHHEASMLTQLCHPFLPYLFRICRQTTVLPCHAVSWGDHGQKTIIFM